MDTKDQNNFALIERFFAKKMTTDELKAFDNRIQTAPSFAKEVSLYKAIHSSTGIPSEIDYSKPKKRSRKWGVLLLLGALSVLSFFIWQQGCLGNSRTQTKSEEEIIKVPHTTPLVNPLETTPTNPPIKPFDTNDVNNPIQIDPEDQPVQDSTPPKLEKTEIAAIAKAALEPMALNVSKSDNYKEYYRQKKYREVIELLPDTLPKLENSNTIEQALILSTSLLFESEYKKAIVYLEQLNKSENIIRQKSDIQWYLSLAYLMNQQAEKARPLLQALQNTKYNEKAQRLLNQLF